MIQIAESIVNKYRKKAEAQRVRLRIRSDHNLPPVSGDARSLERALTALVDNAIKFSPYGGDVEIRLHPQKDRVEIAVEDHGIGIDPNIRPHIFDRYFHVEKSGGDLFGGIGLGLAITRQVIQQHKGTLDVESRPGKGSTFTISLLKAM